jgi:hypothetical protein
MADKTHLHHLLTNQGFSHAFTARLICFIQGFILLETHWLRGLPQELVIAILISFMLLVTVIFKNLGHIKGFSSLVFTRIKNWL